MFQAHSLLTASTFIWLSHCCCVSYLCPHLFFLSLHLWILKMFRRFIPVPQYKFTPSSCLFQHQYALKKKKKMHKQQAVTAANSSNVQINNDSMLKKGACKQLEMVYGPESSIKYSFPSIPSIPPTQIHALEGSKTLQKLLLANCELICCHKCKGVGCEPVNHKVL